MRRNRNQEFNRETDLMTRDLIVPCIGCDKRFTIPISSWGYQILQHMDPKTLCRTCR